MFCPNCGANNYPNASYCVSCGMRLNYAQNTPSQFPDLPMKWHKYLVYIGMWSSIAYYLYEANQMGQYDRISPMITNKIFMFQYFAYAVLCFWLWWQLKNFNRKAWSAYVIFLVLSIWPSMIIRIVFLITNVQAYIMAGPGFILYEAGTFLVVCIASELTALLNFIYYKKRAMYFVN